jgi:ribonuclease R
VKPHQPGGGRGKRGGRDGQRDRSGGAGGSGARGVGQSGKGGRRPGGQGGARVVWPPQQRESAKEAIEQLMHDRGLARRFEPGVEHAARAAREHPRVAVGAAARRDLRELATFTIDPVTARDFDDAISAQRGDNGAITVWVHIADVSAYVREGSPLDVEARERATSVYVPGAVEPMLPEALSNDACSLVPGRERAAVTVELELHGAEVRRTAFYRSRIRSDERLDYDRVDAIFAGRETAREPWAQPLAAAREASAALAQERLRHGGALTLESEEPEFDFDEHGEVSDIKGRVQTESHRLIEHLMIVANEAVAQELQRKATPCLYRVHERPRAASVERLVEQLASLGVASPAVGAQMSPAQAAALVGEASRLVEAHVQSTIARARGGDAEVAPTGGRQALTGLVLRALQPAYYSPRNLGHAGLGSGCYCHFTSPIRRYPDLVCHRALLATLGGPERAPRAESLTELGEWTSQREREAMQLERDGDDVARCFALERELLARGLEQTFPGEVVGLIGAGAFVAFGLPAGPESGGGGYRYEGMLPVRRLAVTMAGRALKEGEDGAPAPEGGAGLGTVGSSNQRAGPSQASRQDGGRPSGGGRRGRGVGAMGSDGRATREWWELNEQGTVLRGERSGMTLRLGDPIMVTVRRVDPRRGRVDLDLAPTDEEQQAGGRRPKRASRGPAKRASRGR